MSSSNVNAVYLTVDVEAHRVEDEITGPSNDSLGQLLDVFRQFQFAGTFFVDFCGVKKWGDDFIRKACDRIRSDHHDVQLHIHPNYYFNDAHRWYLSDYSSEEQREVIDYAVDRYKTIIGRPPVAFRAGAFGIDEETIRILLQKGLRIDSSYVLQREGCRIHPSSFAPSMYNGILELPFNPLVTLGWPGKPRRLTPLDFNWIPLTEMKRSMRRLTVQKIAPVILMHSSSLCLRAHNGAMIPSRLLHHKIIQFFEFIRTEFSPRLVISLGPSDLSTQPKLDLIWVKNPLRQYAVLLYQSMIGFRFKKSFFIFLFLNCIGFVWLLIEILLHV